MTIQKFEVPDWIRSVLIVDPTDIWGNVVGIGLNELIAVLSGAKRFDRRGSIFFYDTFEGGLSKWFTTCLGTNASAEVSSTYALFGGLSVKMVGGSDGGLSAKIFHRQYYPSASKLGLEFAFTVVSGADNIEWQIAIYTGTRVVYGLVKYDQNLTKLQYWNSASAWADLQTGVNLSTLTGVFHVGKLVIDPATEKYVRFLLGKDEYDMSALSCEATDDTTAPYMLVSAKVVSDSGQNATIYVDNVVLTQNEPS